MIEVKVPLPDGYGTMHWGMVDSVALELVQAFYMAMDGKRTKLQTPMGLFEFKNIQKEGAEYVRD